MSPSLKTFADLKESCVSLQVEILEVFDGFANAIETPRSRAQCDDALRQLGRDLERLQRLVTEALYTKSEDAVNDG